MSLRDLLPEIPAFERRFQRKYQLRTVLRMNDVLAERGLTQKDVVARTGWSKGFVSRLLSGGGNLTLRTLARFEEAVGVDVLEVSAATPGEAPVSTRRLTATPAAVNGFDLSMNVTACLHQAGVLSSRRFAPAPDA